MLYSRTDPESYITKYALNPTRNTLQICDLSQSFTGYPGEGRDLVPHCRTLGIGLMYRGSSSSSSLLLSNLELSDTTIYEL